MAWWQRHFRNVDGVPCAKDDASRVGVFLDRVNHLCELVDPLSGVVGVHVRVRGPEMPPLKAVHRAKIALLSVAEARLFEKLFGSVGVPDPNLLLREHVGVGAAGDEPQQFFRHTSVAHHKVTAALAHI